MDSIVLFLHLLGVAVLVGSVTTTLVTTLRIQTAGSVAELRTLAGATTRIEAFIAPAMVIIIASGLYLVARHGHIPWTAGWVDTALFVAVLLTVIGRTIEARDAKRLHTAIAHASDDWPQAELREIQLSASPIYTVFFGSSQVVALLYVMTNKPGLAVSIAVCAIAAVAALIAATVRIRSIRRATHARPADVEA